MTKKEIISKIKKIKGVDDSKAKAIYDAGFTSVEKLKKAGIEELSKIKGINKGLAKTIVTEIGKKEAETKKVEKKKTEKEGTKEKKVEIVEKEIKKIKPKLSKEMKEKLELREKMKKRKPEFLRYEWFRYKRLGMKWRKGKGIQSKIKKHVKYRIASPRIGYSSPKEVKALHSSGFREVMVYNVNEIESVNPNTEAARIGHSVGAKKRNEMEKKADTMGIRILNRGAST
ncbi:MAG: 50S ribosomal protein L32e [Thermoplasmatales archaeon]|nr:50S ribosomal protein L32e [Thermoplasmatales archaeon]